MVRASLLISTAVVSLLVTQAAAAQSGSGAQVGPTPDPAAAMTAAPTAANSASEYTGGLQDILVTARRVEERLQTTPVAVTAVTGQMLLRTQVANTADLQRTAPSLVVATGSASTSGFTFVSIRGQGNLTPIIANDPAVATYVDGVYIARPSQGLTDFIDIARVEVLRGPQGTLFGRNTTGGALNIISNDPVHKLELAARAEYGNYNTSRLEGLVNVPLGENVAARFVYSYNDRDGYGHNRTLDRDVNDQTSHFVRGKVKFDGDGFDVTVSGDYNHLKDKGQLNVLSAYNSAIIAGPLATAFGPSLQAALHTKDAWYTSYAGGVSVPSAAVIGNVPADVRDLYGTKPFDMLTAYGFGAVVNIDLGAANLKSISGFRYQKAAGLIDTDASAAPILATFGGSRSRQVSEELQLSGNLTEKLSYITGAYFSRETGYEYSYSQIFGGAIRQNLGDATNITKGLYAQVYYKLSDTLRATGGVRYTWDTRDTVLHNKALLGLTGNTVVGAASSTSTGLNCTNANVTIGTTADGTLIGDPVTAGVCNLPQNAKFDYPAWTAGLDWQATDDIFVYIKTSGAAKAGGWNIRAGALPAFKPEKVKDIEVGLKGDFFDKHLRANVAAFHTWKNDVQAVVNAVVPGAGVTQYIQNNGKARIYGAEFELTVLPWTGMEITGNFSLLHGEYKSGSFSEVQTVNGVPTVVDLSGLPLPQLPKRQLNLGATQSFPIGDGTLAVHGDFAYVSAQHFDSVRAAPTQPAAVQAQYAIENALGRLPGYGLFNGRIGYTFNTPRLEVYAFGRNLAAKKYNVRTFPDLYQQLGIAAEYVGNPRTYGVGISWKY